MELMTIYNQVRECPKDAQRPIQAGKLKGKTDINPMWRIKRLTELFGPCGEGWKTVDETFWTTPGANGEVIAWCSLKLLWFDCEIGEWSDPVFGIGGSMMVDTQKGNLTSNDEAYKMAYTDAISVACKALGFAADIYWQGDSTKYERNEQREVAPPSAPVCKRCLKLISPKKCNGQIYTPETIAENAVKAFGSELCWDCMTELKAERAASSE